MLQYNNIVEIAVFHYTGLTVKVALQILERKFYRNIKKSSLYPKAFKFSFIKPPKHLST